MKGASKLRAVETALSPRQIALLEIENWRKFPTPRECLVAMMDGRASTSDDWAGQVRESVRLKHKGAKPEALHRLQREGLREAWFLLALAGRCLLDLEHDREAIGLQRRLVHALTMVLFLTAQSKSEWLEQLPDPLQEAEKFLFRVRGLQDAVRLIEREYFGGRSILFEETEAWLKDEVASAESLVGLYNQTCNLSVGVESQDSAFKRARDLAAEWVTYTRAEIHEKLDEREDATALLKPMFGRE
ncbi:MAG TPA: hypothetical protein VHN77_03540 [Phycisphaerales bacterium]|nr:hypothetical protein [Phycisphaerales bacterium]